MSYRNHRANRDHNHVPIVEGLEACGVFVIDLSSVGGGCPDLLCYRRATGLLRLLEIKNPETTAATHRKVDRKLSETEIKQAAFRSLVPTWVVKTPDEAREAMGIEMAGAGPSFETRAIRSTP